MKADGTIKGLDFSSKIASVRIGEEQFRAYKNPRVSYAWVTTSSAPLKKGHGAMFEILIPYGADDLGGSADLMDIGICSGGTFGGIRGAHLSEGLPER